MNILVVHDVQDKWSASTGLGSEGGLDVLLVKWDTQNPLYAFMGEKIPNLPIFTLGQVF
jgi:hypothetical protein